MPQGRSPPPPGAGQVGPAPGHRVPGHVGRGLDVRVAGEPGEQRGFALGLDQRDIDDVDGQQVGLAGVKAALENVDVRDVGGRQAQQLRTAARRGASGASATVKGSRISESRIMVLRARVDRAAGKVEGRDFTGVAFLRTAKPCGARLW